MKKPNVIVWGTGKMSQMYLNSKIFRDKYNIFSLVDNNCDRWGSKINGYVVLSPEEGLKLNPDCVLIWTRFYPEIINQIKKINEFLEIRTYKESEEEIINAIKKKYKNTYDKEIKEIIEEYESNGINIFGTYHSEQCDYRIFYDEDGDPYALFENKRMYFPKDYKGFFEKEGEIYVPNILSEQGEQSPHRYINEENYIKDNSVIVDAGVCEGNFALRYIEKAKKIYLIEADPIWANVLKKTFLPYKDKTVICEKYLDKQDGKNTICLDSLIKEPIDFLKMDIEGYEVNALLGGKNILRNSRASCAICSYHKYSDEDNIRFILEALGYYTKTSDGYMFFIHDDDMRYTMDFRRGIVYAGKY